MGAKNKKVVLTDEQIAECAKYAAVGLNLEQIAALMDVSPATMDEIISRQEGVAQAIEKGRSQGIGKIAGTLFQQAMKGNTTAAIFYLKTRARWAEARPDDPDKDDDARGVREFKLNYKE